MRILLKISGEVLAWEKKKWYDSKILENIKNIIKDIKLEWVELAIVVWWWNLMRWEELKDFSLYSAHNMGLISSCINAFWLEDYLNNNWIKSISYHSIGIDWVLKKFSKIEVIESLKNNKVVIFWWWTWNPYFTTDSWAVLRALEISADLLIKATKVNWIFDKDPEKYTDAKHIETATYDEVIINNLKVMDLTSVLLAKEHNLPMKVVSIYEEEAILKAIRWEKIWTNIVL